MNEKKISMMIMLQDVSRSASRAVSLEMWAIWARTLMRASGVGIRYIACVLCRTYYVSIDS